MEYREGSIVFGDWRIVKLIGEGANGKVYEIEKTDYYGIKTKSALKIVKIPRSFTDVRDALYQGMDEKTVTDYFQGFVHEIVKEVAIMSTLKSHANIVSYEDHSVIANENSIGWDILIRMELLIPFTNYILQHKVTEKEVIRLGKELCQALVFCQKKGLIHRDIKPGNIFANEEGQFKLGDFGIARTIEKTTGGLSKKGTENYMAPEVYLGKEYGQSVDVYSVGLVLYELMNDRRLPFYPPITETITFVDRENALGKRIRGIDVIPAPKWASEAFSKVILKACSYNPKDRYHSAAEMLMDLEKINVSIDKLEDSDLDKTIAENEETVGDEDKTVYFFETRTSDLEEECVMDTVLNCDLKIESKIEEPKVKESETAVNGEQRYYAEKKVEKKDNLIKERNRNTGKRNLLSVLGAGLVVLVVGIAIWIGTAEKRKEKAFVELRTKIEYRRNERLVYSKSEYESYYDSLEKEANKLVKSYPEDERAYLYLADIYTLQNEINNAAIILDAGQKEAETFFEIAFRLEQLEKYVEKIELAEACEQEQDFFGAEKAYKQAINIDPEIELAYLNLKNLYEEDGSFDKGVIWMDEIEHEVYREIYRDDYDEWLYEAYLIYGQRDIWDKKYDRAKIQFEKAIELDSTNEDAYLEIYDMYTKRGKYSAAIKWLNKVEDKYVSAPINVQDMLNECWAGRVNYLMKNKKYKTLLSEFNNHSNEIPNSGFFQNGKYSLSAKDGKGLILSTWGAYYGKIKDEKRKGKGIQFGTYTNKKLYSITNAEWKNNKANGKFTLKYVYVNDSGKNETYSGKVKDNMYHGTIYMTVKCSDGVRRKFKGSAKNGTFKCIRVAGKKKYVYMEGVSSTWYYYMHSKKDLENHGVWRSY